MIMAQVQTRCLECGDEHPMLTDGIDEEPFDGQCPVCRAEMSDQERMEDGMTPHEMVEDSDDR